MLTSGWRLAFFDSSKTILAEKTNTITNDAASSIFFQNSDSTLFSKFVIKFVTTKYKPGNYRDKSHFICNKILITRSVDHSLISLMISCLALAWQIELILLKDWTPVVNTTAVDVTHHWVKCNRSELQTFLILRNNEMIWRFRSALVIEWFYASFSSPFNINAAWCNTITSWKDGVHGGGK